MDKITHQVRLSNWQKIIEQCNNRPQGTTVKQWVKDNGINEKTYYYWLRRVRREAYSQMTPELPVVPSSEPQTPYPTACWNGRLSIGILTNLCNIGKTCFLPVRLI